MVALLGGMVVLVLAEVVVVDGFLMAMLDFPMEMRTCVGLANQTMALRHQSKSFAYSAVH